MPTTLTITEGTHTVDDCYLKSSSAGTNFGSATELYCGYSGVFPFDHTYRALLRFPLSDIPADACIRTAKMTLRCTTAAASGEAAAWLPLTTRGWVELEATWTDYKHGTPWTTAGGDYNVFGGGLFNLPVATGDFDITDITAAEIQDAIDDDEYFNVILKRTTEAAPTAWIKFASGEHATTAWRPRLIITYIPIGVQLLGDVQIYGDVRLL